MEQTLALDLAIMALETGGQLALGKEESYRFGSFEVSEKRGILRDGKRVDVEPRIRDLALALIKHHQRTVSKQELMDLVWKNQVVEEATLNQAIYKLRRILGDPAKNSGIIRTVHRQGFQFIARLEEANSPTRRGIPIRALLAGTILLIGLGLLLNLVRMEVNGPELSREPATNRIAIMPFSATEEGPMATVGLMLTDFFFAKLSSTRGLEVRSLNFSKYSSLNAPSMEQFAIDNAVRWVVHGSLNASLKPEKAGLAVVLYEKRPEGMRETPLGSFEIPLMVAADQYAQFDILRETVIRYVLNNLSQILSTPIEVASETDNPEAYRLLLLGYRLLSEFSCGSGAASDILRRSVDLDDSNATAWAALGFAYHNEVWACGKSKEYTDKALEAAQQALSLDSHNKYAVNLMAILETEKANANGAMKIIAAALEENPQSALIHTTASYTLNYLGRLEESGAHLQKALSIDPLVLWAESGDTPNVYLHQGKWQKFLDLQAGLPGPVNRFYRGYALLRLGKDAEARDVLRPAFRDNPTDVFSRLANALLEIMEGDLSGAKQTVLAVSKQRRLLGNTDGEMTFKESWLLAFAGDNENAIGTLGRSIAQGFTCGECIANAPYPEELRNSQAFQALISSLP